MVGSSRVAVDEEEGIEEGVDVDEVNEEDRMYA